ERAGLAEAVHEGQEMPVSPVGEIADHPEPKRGAVAEVDNEFVMAVFEHVVKHGTAPVPRRLALTARTIFKAVGFVGFGIVPAKAAPLIDRVQGIDED